MKKSAAEDFVPFEPTTQRGPVESSPQLKVVPKPGAKEPASDFTPFETQPGTSGPVHSAKAHSLSAAASAASPSISLQRDGDRITSIRIECSCGQIVELSCTY